MTMRGAYRLVLALIAVGGCNAQPIDGTMPDGGGDDAAPMIGCAADKDCGGMTPRCDKNSSTCVPCLPLNDNCTQGARCVPKGNSYECVTTCMVKADCAGGKDCCNSVCVDTTADLSNCGACGHGCAAPAHGTASCTASVCGLAACDKGWDSCDKDPANGCETDLSLPAHCGACDTTCPAPGPNADAACKAGVCATDCKAGFADCDMDAKNGCEVTLASDGKNCGACGTECMSVNHAMAACTMGKCVVGGCDFGFADCNMNPADGCEAGLLDVNNCGGCGKVCGAVAHGTPGCGAGVCGVGMCDALWGNCDNNPQNGCERDLSSDLMHCGACFKPCVIANGMPGCIQGKCGVIGCNQGFGDCDKDASNGCESAVATDAKNCGACGMACPVPANAAAMCAGGKCSAVCLQGFADCDNNMANGCEVDLRTPQNCAMCGKACGAVANGQPGCNMGVCGVGMCSPLFGDCDGMAANGCELNLATDMQNCGACGKPCALANAVSSCMGGKCNLSSCNANFDDCDKNAANGCEAGLMFDAKNCGSCGSVCPMNTPACDGGMCTVDDFPPIYLLYELELG